jgi:hypothetical protein
LGEAIRDDAKRVLTNRTKTANDFIGQMGNRVFLSSINFNVLILSAQRSPIARAVTLDKLPDSASVSIEIVLTAAGLYF